LLGAQPKVLLPHPGESARLLSCTTDEVQRDREGAAAQLSAQSGAIAVLKGAGTIVCEGGRLYRNTTGNPGMATGGSGDVLAGLVAALLAQGMEPFDAACLSVHVHGKAGDRVDASVRDALDYYKRRNAQQGDPVIANEGKARIETWTQGGGMPVRVVTIDGGGHAWPGGERGDYRGADGPPDWPATERIWEFFAPLTKKRGPETGPR
jgi:hypothetical protein